MYRPIKRGELPEIFQKMIYPVLIAFSVFLILASLAEPWIYKDVQGAGMICCVLLCSLAYRGVLSCIRRLSGRVIRLAVWIGIGLAFLIQLWIVSQMQLDPAVDLIHVYRQCREMLGTGDPRITNVEYFGFNTNNIPITIVLYWVFRFFGALGLENCRLAGGIFNVSLLALVYILCWLILKKVTTERAAAAVMVLLLANPAFYAYAPYYYTDTVSLGFTMLSVYAMFCGYLQAVRWKRAALFMAAGFVMGLAVQIRVTSIFIVLAVAVCALIRGEWRRLLRRGFMFVGGFLLFLGCWSRVYAHHVDFDTSESGITVEHFLMMGSTGRGTYDADDMRFTRSFETHREKVENNRRVYVQRLRENGLWGNLRLVLFKEAVVWGIGARGYQQYTENVVERTRCYDWIVGEDSADFRAYMQAYAVVLPLVLLLGLAEARRRSNPGMLILSVYWAGALVFYMFWEAHPRHPLSFLPLLTMLAVPWIESFLAREEIWKRNNFIRQ